mmetsp:Transcript_5098/g.10392  ORF Transcript_5098/g.10392 Transcript_5098/m.10392 type:complete len:85 (+) Transcript_5098:24-278(+)
MMDEENGLGPPVAVQMGELQGRGPQAGDLATGQKRGLELRGDQVEEKECILAVCDACFESHFNNCCRLCSRLCSCFSSKSDRDK